MSTPPGLVGEPQQPPSGELQNLEAMDLSTSVSSPVRIHNLPLSQDDPMDRTIHDDLEELERVLGDYDRIQQ